MDRFVPSKLNKTRDRDRCASEVEAQRVRNLTRPQRLSLCGSTARLPEYGSRADQFTSFEQPSDLSYVADVGQWVGI